MVCSSYDRIICDQNLPTSCDPGEPMLFYCLLSTSGVLCISSFSTTSWSVKPLHFYVLRCSLAHLPFTTCLLHLSPDWFLGLSHPAVPEERKWSQTLGSSSSVFWIPTGSSSSGFVLCSLGLSLTFCLFPLPSTLSLLLYSPTPISHSTAAYILAPHC